jgi:hypothetical protein
LINASLSKQRGHVFAFFFASLNLLFVLQNLGCSLFSENLLNTWNDTCNVNDFLHEHVDVVQQVFMGWIMDDSPVGVILCLENGVDLEDWNQLLSLRISDDPFMKI